MRLPLPVNAANGPLSWRWRIEWLLLLALLLAATVILGSSRLYDLNRLSNQGTVNLNSAHQSEHIKQVHLSNTPPTTTSKDETETFRRIAVDPTLERSLDPHAHFSLPTDFYKPKLHIDAQLRRPPENATVDLYAILARCDLALFSTQECLDFLETESDVYLVERTLKSGKQTQHDGAATKTKMSAKNAAPHHSSTHLPSPCDRDHPILYHGYWRGLMHHSLTWALKSFLFTQNLNCSRYVLWLGEDTLTDFAQIEELVKLEKAANVTSAPEDPNKPKRYFPTLETHASALREALSYAPFITLKRFNLSDALWATLRLSKAEESDLRKAVDLRAAQSPLRSFNLTDRRSVELLMSNRLHTLLNESEHEIKLRFDWPVSMMASSAVLKGWSVSDSDLVRFLLLDTYGGLYVDTDAIFLRDLRPWFNTPANWAYSWSHFGFYNTAFLRFNGLDEEPDALKMWRLEELKLQKPTTLPLSNDATPAIVHRILTRGIENGLKFHPFFILNYTKGEATTTKKYPMAHFEHAAALTAERRLAMVPSSVFDPIWRTKDKASDEIIPTWKDFNGLFLSSSNRSREFRLLQPKLGANFIETASIRDLRTLDRFFPGAPAYHVHKITQRIQTDSWAHILLQHYNCFLTSQCPNIYGEWMNEAWWR